MSWTGKLCGLIALAGSLAAAEPSYYREIQPILQKNCTGCHQPAKKSSELDLTTFDGFRAGGKRGPAFTPGDAGGSVVVRYLTGELKPAMPLGGSPLSKEDIDVVREWIASGGRDDSPSETAAVGPTVYHQPPVITALRFSPDGKTLAVSGNR